MTVEVRCFSRGGHTRALAEAVAGELGLEVLELDAPMQRRTDVLFLGASIYGGKPSPEALRFVQRNCAQIGTIVVFGSSGSGKTAYTAIEAVAHDCGVTVSPMYFHCPGAFMFLHRNRPNQRDCEAAARFAREQIKRLGENENG